ncbi:MAG TPA: sigma-70 family RNA polymerase sigma factor [Polyangiales bacterium]
MGWFQPQKSKQQREFEADALQYLDTLYAHALRLTRSPADAEDLVQDTFVKALRFYERFERGSNLKAWLLRIQFNSFVNKYRRHVKEHAIAESMSHEPAGEATIGRGALRALMEPQEDALRPVVARELQAALAELPDDHRTVVILADVEELSYKEIAEVVGCPIGTVMSRLHRARRTLQQRLAEHGESLGLQVAKAPQTAVAGSKAEEPVSLASYRREHRERSRG